MTVTKPNLKSSAEPKVQTGLTLHKSTLERLHYLARASGISTSLLMRHIINEALEAYDVPEELPASEIINTTTTTSSGE